MPERAAVSEPLAVPWHKLHVNELPAAALACLKRPEQAQLLARLRLDQLRLDCDSEFVLDALPAARRSELNLRYEGFWEASDKHHRDNATPLAQLPSHLQDKLEHSQQISWQALTAARTSVVLFDGPAVVRSYDSRPLAGCIEVTVGLEDLMYVRGLPWADMEAGLDGWRVAHLFGGDRRYTKGTSVDAVVG